MEGSKEAPPNRLAETEAGFKNQTVLITGGTGFVGKVLIEKILRTCPLVRKIYVLIRTKKGKNHQKRLDEIFAGPLFDLLKDTRGTAILKKVIAIPGDVAELKLGLSQEHRRLLTEETDMIYHAAATIRFDEVLRKAVLLNTRGTKLMLELAKECKKLSVFVHVSTAYCYLNERVLYEKSYPPPQDPHNTIRLAEILDEKTLESISQKLLKDYPNTYAFTKALGESLVEEEMDNLPIVIARLPVLVSIFKEPIRGWSDNINGPMGLLIAAGKGVLRTMYCDPKGYADFLPVDIAVNAIMLIAYDYKVYKTRRIYNCTSSHEIKVTWKEIIDIGRTVIHERMPFNGVVWYPGGSMKQSRLLHNICVVLFHYIPATFLDTIIFLSGNKPVLWRVQKRITAGFDVFEYYANNQWDFNNDASLQARDMLNETETRIYQVHNRDLDLYEYFYHAIHGARLYILNEIDETLPAARRHMKIMWAVDKICKLLIILAFGYFLLSYFLRFISKDA